MQPVKPPNVFISYAHTSQEHSDRVLRMVQRLYGDGVTAVFDRYHLRPGADVNVFMEQIANNPEIDFVVVISDQGYTEKVNQRAGSAGIEGTILSTVMYQQLAGGEHKVVIVLFERDESGKACLPSMLEGKLYIDMSSEDLYQQNWPQLMHTLYKKPPLTPPELGQTPRYISDPNYKPLPTESKSQTYLESIKRGSPQIVGHARDYLDALTTSIRRLPLAVSEEAGYKRFDSETMLKALDGFKPVFEGYLQVLHESMRHGSTSLLEHLPRLFQELTELPSEVSSASNLDAVVAEHLTVLRHTMLLYTAALLIKEHQLSHLDALLNHNYLHDQQAQYFTWLQADLKKFPETYKTQRGQNFLEPLGSFLMEYVTTPLVSRLDLMQADAVLLVKSLKRRVTQRVFLWHASTWPYWNSHRYPFPVFSTFASRRVLTTWGNILEFSDLDRFQEWAQESLKTHTIGNIYQGTSSMAEITAVDQWASRM